MSASKMDDVVGKKLARTKLQPERRRGNHRAVKPQLQSISTIDGRTGPAKLFKRLVSDIEVDRGGRDELSEVERQLVEAYAGCCVLIANIHARIALGEDISIGEHSLVASTMTRLANKLGLRRRARDVSPSLADILSEEEPAHD
jgi:hypothetical protein